MKIFSAEQIRRWDEATIAEQGISSFELMERAAFTCVNWLIENDNLQKDICIFCGTGNNGGDGFAMARILFHAGAKVRVYAVSGDVSKLNLQNRNLLHGLIPVNIIDESSRFPALQPADIVVEALFGTGLKRKPEGIISELVAHLNSSGCTIISIDIPGGMFTDQVENEKAITATHTLTFQSPKFSFFFTENEKHLGQVHIMDIGLSRDFLKNERADFELLEATDVSKLIRKRKLFSHKGDYGHAGLIAGSKGMMGAAVLAAKGCLHAGAGKLTCYVPDEGYNIIQTAVPAAMAKTTGTAGKFRLDLNKKHQSLGVGPGLGRHKNEKDLLREIFSIRTPLVLDADALNAVAGNKKLLKEIPGGAILTPHPGEFDRLFGTVSNRVSAAVDLAAKFNLYIILKGKYTCIATPEGVGYFNSTGNAGMARGGMGDVLTGILTGLLAQKYTPLQASLLGVYWHGLAADLAAADLSEQTLQPENVICYLSAAWNKLCHIG